MAEKSIGKPSGAQLAVRCHDVALSLAGRDVGDFEEMVILGMAVRLALHLRGVQAISYELLRQVALHLLQIPPIAVRRVVDILAEALSLRKHSGDRKKEHRRKHCLDKDGSPVVHGPGASAHEVKVHIGSPSMKCADDMVGEPQAKRRQPCSDDET